MLIDTNVWSELSRSRPEPKVFAFIARNSRRCVLSTIVLAEIEFGLAKDGDATRRRRLAGWLQDIRLRCGDRVLLPDDETAAVWGGLKARLEIAGTPIADMDLLIAAQAIAANVPLVTRNVADMERTGAEIINPWTT